PAVLKALKVPVSSQGLVFSRTSLQVDRIAPWTPRAIYFSDDVYVGWVQGGPIMEIAAVDPSLGAVFYTVTQEPGARPVIARQTHVHNLITAAGYQARSTPDDAVRVEGAAERLVRAMLFAKEAALPGAVAGTSTFAAEFAKPGPRDARGRSLRDLDLEHRV